MRFNLLHRKIRSRILAGCLACAMVVTSGTVNICAKDSEELHLQYDDEDDTEFLAEDNLMTLEGDTGSMVTGSSSTEFTANGTAGQVPDVDWTDMEARYTEMKGSHMDCSSFASYMIGLTLGGSANAGNVLLKNGYKAVLTQYDTTVHVDGAATRTFNSTASQVLAGLRRGDVVVFYDSEGKTTHIAVVTVTSKGYVHLCHGGLYSGSDSNYVGETNIAWFMSSDPASDVITVYRKTSNPGYAESLSGLEYVDPDANLDKEGLAVRYTTHVQSYGWQDEETVVSTWKQDGEMSGTSGEAKRLEGIRIKITGDSKLGVTYRTHIQSYGWEKTWKKDGAMSGTSGEAKRLEAIQIKLTGSDASKYDIYYRVHAQTYGWLGWAKNGAYAGTAGLAKRLEAIEIVVLPKGETPSDGVVGNAYIELGKNSTNGDSDGMINYMTHVQTYGNQNYVYDGSISGTSGEAKRLEAIRINVNEALTGVEGGVCYTTHVQTYGWQDDVNDSSTWSKNGELSGTTAEAKRLEAIRIKLTGEMANQYDIYYRVHVQTYGWLGWTSNGNMAGTSGLAKRLEAIQIEIVPKGSAAPGDTSTPCIEGK